MLVVRASMTHEGLSDQRLRHLLWPLGKVARRMCGASKWPTIPDRTFPSAKTTNHGTEGYARVTRAPELFHGDRQKEEYGGTGLDSTKI